MAKWPIDNTTLLLHHSNIIVAVLKQYGHNIAEIKKSNDEKTERMLCVNNV